MPLIPLRSPNFFWEVDFNFLEKSPLVVVLPRGDEDRERERGRERYRERDRKKESESESKSEREREHTRDKLSVNS